MIMDWREWGAMADFVCGHAGTEQGCSRPVFVRATLAWSETWAIKSMDKVGDNSFLTWLYKYFPIIFGPKAVLCINCNSVVILSSLSSWLFRLRMNIFDPAREQSLQFALYEGDVKNIPAKG